MTTKTKTPDSNRVEQLIERYGADPRRFPEHERADSMNMIAHDAELSELLADAAHLDAMLDTSTSRSPSAELMRRVAEVPLRYPRAAQIGPALSAAMKPLSMIRAAFAGFTATAFGVWVGVASLPLAEDLAYQEDPIEDFASLMFADDFTLDIERAQPQEQDEEMP